MCRLIHPAGTQRRLAFFTPEAECGSPCIRLRLHRNSLLAIQQQHAPGLQRICFLAAGDVQHARDAMKEEIIRLRAAQVPSSLLFFRQGCSMIQPHLQQMGEEHRRPALKRQ